MRLSAFNALDIQVAISYVFQTLSLHFCCFSIDFPDQSFKSVVNNIIIKDEISPLFF